MRHLALIVILVTSSQARALEAEVIAELVAIRQLYWDVLTGPHWATRNYRTETVNRAAINRIRPQIKALDRMFGADHPELGHALAGLGGLPSGSTPLDLIKQRDSLIAQYDQIDRFIKTATGPYDPSWRDTRFGRELVHLTDVLLKKWHNYERRPDAFTRNLAEWKAGAAVVARFAPDPVVGEILDRMIYLIEHPPGRHAAAPDSVRMRVVLEASRALIDQLDADGLEECRDALAGKRALPAPLRALPAPPRKS